MSVLICAQSHDCDSLNGATWQVCATISRRSSKKIYISETKFYLMGPLQCLTYPYKKISICQGNKTAACQCHTVMFPGDFRLGGPSNTTKNCDILHDDALCQRFRGFDERGKLSCCWEIKWKIEILKFTSFSPFKTKMDKTENSTKNIYIWQRNLFCLSPDKSSCI